jgi:hypothetical protein
MYQVKNRLGILIATYTAPLDGSSTNERTPATLPRYIPVATSVYMYHEFSTGTGTRSFLPCAVFFQRAKGAFGDKKGRPNLCAQKARTAGVHQSFSCVSYK